MIVMRFLLEVVGPGDDFARHRHEIIYEADDPGEADTTANTVGWRLGKLVHALLDQLDLDDEERQRLLQGENPNIVSMEGVLSGLLDYITSEEITREFDFKFKDPK